MVVVVGVWLVGVGVVWWCVGVGVVVPCASLPVVPVITGHCPPPHPGLL